MENALVAGMDLIKQAKRLNGRDSKSSMAEKDERAKAIAHVIDTGTVYLPLALKYQKKS